MPVYIGPNPIIFRTNLVKSLTVFVVYKTLSSHTSQKYSHIEDKTSQNLQKFSHI